MFLHVLTLKLANVRGSEYWLMTIKYIWNLKGKFLILSQYCSHFQSFICIWTLESNSNFHANWISHQFSWRKRESLSVQHCGCITWIWITLTEKQTTSRMGCASLASAEAVSRHHLQQVHSPRLVGMTTGNKENLWDIKESGPFFFFLFSST